MVNKTFMAHCLFKFVFLVENLSTTYLILFRLLRVTFCDKGLLGLNEKEKIQKKKRKKYN